MILSIRKIDNNKYLINVFCLKIWPFRTTLHVKYTTNYYNKIEHERTYKNPNMLTWIVVGSECKIKVKYKFFNLKMVFESTKAYFNWLHPISKIFYKIEKIYNS